MFGASTHCPLLPVNRVCYRDTTMMLDTEKGRMFNKKLDQMIVNKMTQPDSTHPWITEMEWVKIKPHLARLYLLAQNKRN